MTESRSEISLLLCISYSLALLTTAQENGAIFDNCSIQRYYGGLVNENLQQLDTYDRATLSNHLRETHRRVLPYTSSSRKDVWDAMIDLDSEGDMIRLIYRDVDVPAMVYGTAETWNREHLWPKSRGVGTSGPDYTDVHALRPSDWNVNSARGNLFFGDCEDSCTSRPANDEAALDTARDSNIFLPPSDVRGDIARAIMYMELRYSSFDETNTEMLELTDCPDDDLSYQMAYLSDLLRWNAEDPPDDKERRRNERVCSHWQGNRNIFVDFPELAFEIYGQPTSKPYDCSGVITSSAPTISPTRSPGLDAIESAATCRQLQPGDIQVVSFTADNPDVVMFVALEHLSQGLKLYMTDNAWTGVNFLTDEGTLQLIVPSDVPVGTVFGYGVSDSILYGDSWESVGSSSFALATAGDSILLYCIDESNNSIQHLGGMISQTWLRKETDDMDTSSSVIPDSLSSIGAVEIGEEWDNVVYRGTVEGTKENILNALSDNDNWEGSNTERLVYSGGDFSIREELSEGEDPLTNGEENVDESAGPTTAVACFRIAIGMLCPFLLQ